MAIQVIGGLAKDSAEARSALAAYQTKLSEFNAKNAALTPTEERDKKHAIDRIEELEHKMDQIEAADAMVAKFAPQFEAKMERDAEGQRNYAKPKNTSVSSTSIFETRQEAIESGLFIAGICGNRGAMRKCRDQGIITNAMGEGDDLRGGSLVPESLERVLIALREKFGVFRSNALVWPMSSDVSVVPRMVNEITPYFVSENVAITPSDMALSQIRLVAKKLASITITSSELGEDEIVGVAEILANSISYSMALKEDQCCFLGDGTTTYGGILGLANALQAGSKVTATGRATFGTLTNGDFEAMIGKVKMWGSALPKWYISQQGWANSMQRLLNVAGGNTLLTLAQGAPKTFMGFEVVISQVLEQRLSGTTGLPAFYFGDLKTGTIFGSRRGLTLVADSSRYFEQDAIALRATERFDFACHDVGDATNPGGILQCVFG